MSDTSKQERIEEFLRKSLLGDELINTQFHLFSAKALSSSRVGKPRVLCANNALLAKSSKYFLELLSSDINPSNQQSLIDITDDNDIPQCVRMDDYDYESDSDLDVNEDLPPPDAKAEKDKSVQAAKRNKEDDEVSDDGSDSATSDMFVLSPETPRFDEELKTRKEENESIVSSETAIEERRGKMASLNQVSLRLRSLGSRHIFVKDAAFQTWYSLLNYLYTGQSSFLPLSSAAIANPSSTTFFDEPKCSAKSMYRLASKVGLDDLRDEAFAYIKSNLTEHNILQELSCSLMSSHPLLLEMELDMLYSHIASPPVVAGFPALARRIANGELSHGADIVIGIHSRLLKTPRPSTAESSQPSLPVPKPKSSASESLTKEPAVPHGKPTTTSFENSFGPPRTSPPSVQKSSPAWL